MSDSMNKSLEDAIKDRKKEEGKNKKKGGSNLRIRRKTGGAPGSNRRTGRTPRGRNDSKGRDRDAKNRPRKAARKPISKLGIASRRFIRRTRAAGAGKSDKDTAGKPTTAGKKRLRVSNLDFNITHKDLMDLFSKFGSLTKNKIDYDDLGRSLGTAVVEYDKNESAMKAIDEYNGATLDGKTLSVEFDKVPAPRKIQKVAKKVIAKRDIRPVRRDNRRDDRRDNRRDDRRDDRRQGGRRGNNNRRDGNRNQNQNRNRDGGRRDNRQGGNRRRGNN